MAKSHSIAQAKYDSTHCKYYTLKMNLVNDSDVIDRLEHEKSKQGYIKQLIRDDIARTCSVSVSKKHKTPKQILAMLEPYIDGYDGSMYELLNAVTNEYMNK